MICLILAGGFGRRVQSLIGDTPKALISYRGKPLLDHILEKVPENIPVLISTNQKYEQNFREWEKSARRTVEILIENAVNEGQKPGALSAIDLWVKRKQIEDDLLVIGGDNYCGFDMRDFIRAYDGRHALVAVYDTGDLEIARNLGVVKVEGNRIVEFAEKPEKPASTIVSTACYIFPFRVLQLLEQYCANGTHDQLGRFIAYLVGVDEVHAFILNGEWFDLGTELMSRWTDITSNLYTAAEPPVK
ncbi:MAG: sugar phosphate nucleotidyltransferase [Dehalococcoidales bacterium]|jgi:glucose-1-phosphate thymidylyltransferase|nr:sugar phosphate nucleotidyltransferase [Dehalococcoidales bacterium]